jgi:hypothetical protein
MTDEDRKWLPLAEARRRLDGASITEAAIVSRLKAGLLVAKAARRMQERGEGGAATKPVVVDGEAVPQWVWDSIDRRHYYHRWDWAASYFQGKAFDGKTRWLVRLYDIDVDAAAIDRLAPERDMSAAKREVEQQVANNAVAASDHTGAPGRPTSMHIIDKMMRERFSAGVAYSSLEREAEELERLFAENPAYSDLVRPTAKTIKNALRAEYRRLKSPKPEITA